MRTDAATELNPANCASKGNFGKRIVKLKRRVHGCQAAFLGSS